MEIGVLMSCFLLLFVILAKLLIARMEDCCEKPTSWEVIPVTVLLQIVGHLSKPSDVIHLARSCRRWYAILRERQVWQHLYFCLFGKQFWPTSQVSSVKDEVERLCYDLPKIDIHVENAHADEILHVSISKTGRYFCTTSKDCTFKIWLVDHPLCPVFSYDEMRDRFDLRHTQYSEFNADDTMLLVSGVDVSEHSFSGVIVVISLPSFDFITSLPVSPHSVYGTWFGNDTLLSGELELQANLDATSLINLHKTEPTLSRSFTPLFKFRCRNANVVRMLRMIDNFRHPGCRQKCECSSQEQSSDDSQQYHQLTCGRYLVFTKGWKSCLGHEIGLKRIPDVVELRSNSEMTRADLSIDLHGVIVGYAVDPENAQIFVNVRKWPENGDFSDPLEPPMPSTELEIRVVDVASSQLLEAPIYRGHRATTGPDNCFFLFLDVSPNFVASGAEDCACSIWDRHSAALLRKVPFTNVVNCAAFLPSKSTTSEIISEDDRDYYSEGGLLISVSDDFSLKLSYSRRLFNRLPKALQERAVQFDD